MNKPLTFTAEESNSTIKLIVSGTGSLVIDGLPSLEYRLNENDEWQQYIIGTVIELENVGDYVQFQNIKNKLSTSYADYVYFEMFGKIAASGNIQSMLNYSNYCQPYCYFSMFDGCASLIKAPELPATNLAEYCYCNMFYNCISLTKAPKLPATNLANSCYSSMFEDCTNLIEVPELPSTTLAYNCYAHMFEGCKSLTETPELPSTTLFKWCYYSMFRYCTSLTKVSELPATNLAFGCYNNMFDCCTSLKNKPKINSLIERMVYIH